MAGEYYHQPAIRQITRRQKLPPAGQWDEGLRVTVALISEPSNPHDRNAVRVYLIREDGTAAHVGYLPAEVAGRWQRPFLELESEGQIGSCSAFVYEGGNGTPVIVLQLSDPDQAFMLNSDPREAEIPPRSRR